MSVAITYDVYLDTRRNNLFNGTHDDITSYVVSMNWNAGFLRGQDATQIDEPIANPATVNLTLDNTGGEFHQETLGSELLTNGTFATWSSDNPSSWTVTGESGSNPRVSQVAPEYGNGGGGTGAANLYSTSATVSITQSPLTVGTTYRMTISITNVTTGVIGVYNGATRIGAYGEVGEFTEYFVAGATSLIIQNDTAACNVTIDTVSVRAVARYTGLLRPGVLIRVRATYGTTQQLFIGKISEGGIRYGVDNRGGSITTQSVTVTAMDAMRELLDLEYYPPLQTNVTTGDVLERMFDDLIVAWPYAASTWMLGVSGSGELGVTTTLGGAVNIAFDTGRTTFAYAGNVADGGRGVSTQQFIRDVALAEAGGRFYSEPRDGEWVWHDRYHDILNTTSEATLVSTDCVAQDYVYGDDLVNQITLNYTVRELGAANQVLFQARNTPIMIDANSTRQIIGRYTNPDGTDDKRIGGTDFQPMLNTYHYVVTSDRAGATLVGGVSVVAEPGATSVKLTLQNSNIFAVYFQSLQFNGRPLFWYDESVSYEDAQSKRKYDLRPRQPLNIRMIDDPNFAFSVCEFIVSRHKNPTARMNSISFLANLNATNAGHLINRRMGDRITVQNTWLNHDSDYIIIGEAHGYEAATSDHLVTWYLKPVSRDVFWVLGNSERSLLGETTYLNL